MEFIKSFRAVERNYHLIKMRICDLILKESIGFRAKNRADSSERLNLL